VRVVARRRSESSIVAKTAESKVKNTFSGKRVRVLQEVQCNKAPVYATDSQMLGKVVLELVATLSRHQPELVRSS
jgi:hypothetical protein